MATVYLAEDLRHRGSFLAPSHKKTKAPRIQESPGALV